MEDSQNVFTKEVYWEASVSFSLEWKKKKKSQNWILTLQQCWNYATNLSPDYYSIKSIFNASLLNPLHFPAPDMPRFHEHPCQY